MTDCGIVTLDLLVDATKYYDCHHTAADTFDKVDIQGLQESSAVVAVLACALGTIEPRISLGSH